MMRRAKLVTNLIGLTALLLFVCATTSGQSSNPAQTIQNAKQQAAQATSTQAAQGQKTPAPAKSQTTQAPAAKTQAPAAKKPQSGTPKAPANSSASAPAKTSTGAAKVPAKTPAKTAAAPAKTQATAPDKTSTGAAKVPAKAPAKTAAAPAKTQANAPAQKPGKAPAKVAAKAPAKKAPAKAAETKAVAEVKAEEPKVARRDPFAALLNTKRASGPSQEHLPPGKAGLVIATLRIQGIVRGPNGMIAIVANPQQGVYFLREGDQLYDGRVVSIKLDEVAFHEYGKDAFGKPIDRQVAKRLYPIAGEQ